MTLRSVTPLQAKWLVGHGAVLVDIREDEEYWAVHIPGALLVPLSTFDEADFAHYRGKVLLFHCQTGRRTRTHGTLLADKASGCEAYVVEGGLKAWRAQGLPTVVEGVEHDECRRPQTGVHEARAGRAA